MVFNENLLLKPNIALISTEKNAVNGKSSENFPAVGKTEENHTIFISPENFGKPINIL